MDEPANNINLVLSLSLFIHPDGYFLTMSKLGGYILLKLVFCL